MRFSGGGRKETFETINEEVCKWIEESKKINRVFRDSQLKYISIK